jgi:hypothetical protein
MGRFPPGTRVQHSDKVVYRIGPDWSYRREGGAKMSKAEKKADKINKVRRRNNHKVHRLEACATGAAT